MSGVGDGLVTVKLTSSSDVVIEHPVLGPHTLRTKWAIRFMQNRLYLAKLYVFVVTNDFTRTSKHRIMVDIRAKSELDDQILKYHNFVPCKILCEFTNIGLSIINIHQFSCESGLMESMFCLLLSSC